MIYPIKYEAITPEVEFYTEALEMHKEAVQYLSSFAWCKKVIGSEIYTNLGSKLCIFLFETENTSSHDDRYLWVVVGDIPPMYLDTFGAHTTKEVLKDYVKLAENWIEHVKSGKSVEECFPFNAEPTVPLAEILERKVSFIKGDVIEAIDEIAKAP